MNIRVDWRARLAVAAISFIALLLGGCGPSAHDQQIEQRVAAAEAKADAAEKRAKKAEAAAILGTQNPPPPADDTAYHDPNEGDPNASELTNPDSDDSQYDNEVGQALSPLVPDSEGNIDNSEPPAPNALG